MSFHPIDFFYQHAGHVLKPYMTTVAATKDDHCSVCGRSQPEWGYPTEKVVFTQYGVTEVHCVACHSLYEGSSELFGIERIARGSPVPMKLGMAVGCGALVTPQGTTLYLNAFIKKMEKAAKPPFPMVELTGKAAHLSIIDNPPECDQFLYIGNFGRKKRDLVKNLRVSNRDTLFICEESSCTEIPIKCLVDLRKASEGVSESLITSVKRTLKDVFTGQSTPDNEKVIANLTKVADEAPSLVAAIRALPADPHQSIQILRMW
jgi:hypothetical protein